MPRTAVVVQIFVASPSDVQPEREALESLIREMNPILSSSFGVLFELVRWETHVMPAFGTDPQAVINDQIGEDYDVFIGILWARFGTSTPRAASGTMEEFERAYARLQNNANKPEIMFYFKDAAIPVTVDIEQLKKVQTFRASLSEKGGVYATFEDLQVFGVSVRAHLSRLAQKFSRNFQSLLQLEVSEKIADSSIEVMVEDELGYIDYVEICDARTDDMIASMEIISEATVRMGFQFEGHNRDMGMLASSGSNPKSAKRLIKRCADDMLAYAGIIKSQTPIYALNRDGAFEALSNALALNHQFDLENN